MKKAAALILVLAMALALCACGGSKNPLIGTWEKQGNAPYADRIVFTDKVVSLEFNHEHGTETKSYSYKVIDDEHIEIKVGSGSKVSSYQLNGDTLCLDNDGVYYQRVR